MALGAASVGLSVMGPKLLGDATNLIFSGVVAKKIPAGVSKAEMVARLRHEGKGTLADMLNSMHIVAGRGVDFDHVGRLLLVVLVIYLGASLASLLQGRLMTVAVQRTVFRLRAKVQSKLTRLPLSYFDGQPLRRDPEPCHQRHRQHLPDPAADAQPGRDLAADDRRRARDHVRHLPPAGRYRPRHRAGCRLSWPPGSASAPNRNFVKQWATTGKLNGHIEEMYTGHALVRLFGHAEEAEETFARP